MSPSLSVTKHIPLLATCVVYVISLLWQNNFCWFCLYEKYKVIVEKLENKNKKIKKTNITCHFTTQTPPIHFLESALRRNWSYIQNALKPSSDHSPC